MLTTSVAGTGTPEPVDPTHDRAVNSAAGVKAAADYETFLHLLTAQLQNQDPLAPMDAAQFVSQLAQFSQVEQAVQSNETLAEVLTELRATSERIDLTFLGRTVEAASDRFRLPASGPATLDYEVEGDAAGVVATITDASGTIVRQIPGETAAGRRTLTWDGIGANGDRLPEGSYGITIAARNEAGDSLSAATFIQATVDQIRQAGGDTVFVLDTGAEIEREDLNAELTDFATIPAFRRRGLARYLLDTAEREALTERARQAAARQSGALEVTLDAVLRRLPPAAAVKADDGSGA